MKKVIQSTTQNQKKRKDTNDNQANNSDKKSKIVEKKEQANLEMFSPNNFKNFLKENGEKNWKVVTRINAKNQRTLHVMPLDYVEAPPQKGRSPPSGVKLQTPLVQVQFEKLSEQGNITEGRNVDFTLAPPNNKFTMSLSDTKLSQDSINFGLNQAGVDIRSETISVFNAIEAVIDDVKETWWNETQQDQEWKLDVEKSVLSEVTRKEKNGDNFDINKIREDVIERKKESFMENNKTGINCSFKNSKRNSSERELTANDFCYREIYDNERGMVEQWKKVILEAKLQDDYRFKFLFEKTPKIYRGFPIFAVGRTGELEVINSPPGSCYQMPATNILLLEKQKPIIRAGALISVVLRFSTYTTPYRGIRFTFESVILYKNGPKERGFNIENPFPTIKALPIDQLIDGDVDENEKDDEEDEDSVQYGEDSQKEEEDDDDQQQGSTQKPILEKSAHNEENSSECVRDDDHVSPPINILKVKKGGK